MKVAIGSGHANLHMGCQTKYAGLHPHTLFSQQRLEQKHALQRRRARRWRRRCATRSRWRPACAVSWPSAQAPSSSLRFAAPHRYLYSMHGYACLGARFVAVLHTSN